MNSFDIVMEMLSDKEVSKFKSKEEGAKKIVEEAKEKIKVFRKNTKIADQLIKKYYPKGGERGTIQYKEINGYINNANIALGDAFELYRKFGSVMPVNKALDKAPTASLWVTLLTSFLIIPLVLTVPVTAGLSGARKLSENNWKKKYEEYKAMTKGDYAKAYDAMKKDLDKMSDDFYNKYERWLA